MSNKKTEAVATEEVTPSENTQVTETTQEVSTPANALDIQALLEKSSGLDKLETVVSLSPESITLEKVGESFRGIFMGFGEMTVNDPNVEEGKRTIPSAKFLIDKKMCINGGAVLVSELKNAGVKEGTPLEVTYTEKRGNVKIYRITLLG
jgi:hypothetical protein